MHHPRFDRSGRVAAMPFLRSSGDREGEHNALPRRAAPSLSGNGFLLPLLIALIAVWPMRMTGETANAASAISSSRYQVEVNAISSTAFTFSFISSKGKNKSIPSLLEIPAGKAVPGFARTAAGVVTAAAQVSVDPAKSCFQLVDRSFAAVLASICAWPGETSGRSRVSIDAPAVTYAYGLGEQFLPSVSQAMNWIGRVRSPGSEFGNKMVPFEGGWAGNAQFPVLYGLTDHVGQFAIVLDNPYAQTWDLTKAPWIIAVRNGPIRGVILVGEDLVDLRRQFMALAGRPPVPPRKAFGLWVSQYGFDNWEEIEDKLRTLRAQHFPVDGFFLDLQWFGNITKGSRFSKMGGLDWDERNFPDARGHIAWFAQQGIGLVTIEEPYVSEGVRDRATGESIFHVLDRKGFLAKSGPTPQSPAVVLPPTWWGEGGMIDWSNPAAGDFWHDWKRQPLIDIGVSGHWADLGEPELFDPKAFYGNGSKGHADVHNVYNLDWVASIARGYQRHKVTRRPWILTRSGTLGSQRYGISMWSGDIGSNLDSLHTQLGVQSNITLSGVDYFGSDIGGFVRGGLRGDVNEVYTQWFADSALFDVPLRPHTDNRCKCFETAPDRIGDVASNLENLRLRYRLIPYYYSLAYDAYRFGDAVIAPLVYRFPNDETARGLGLEKMIGPSLLAAGVAQLGADEEDVYLPQGVWFDYLTGQRFESEGRWLRGYKLRYLGKFRIPLFAQEGAIIPEAIVDLDGRIVERELRLRVFPTTQGSSTNLYEDDGVSTAYQRGSVRVTRVEQRLSDAGLTLTIRAGAGAYDGADPMRDWSIEAILDRHATDVRLGDTELPESKDAQTLETSSRGWTQTGSKIDIKIGPVEVSRDTVVTVRLE
jgi:alpha-glucosidase